MGGFINVRLEDNRRSLGKGDRRIDVVLLLIGLSLVSGLRIGLGADIW